MFLRLGRIALLACLFSLAGGHWVSLQGVAWLNMVVDRAPEAPSLPSLVLETVSGAKPCPLCVFIQEKSQQEQNSPAENLLLKTSTMIAAHASPVVLTPPRPASRRPGDALPLSSLVHAPPVEPPRRRA